MRVAEGAFEGGPFGEVPVGLLKGDYSVYVYEGLEGPFLSFAAVCGGGGAEKPVGVPRANAEKG